MFKGMVSSHTSPEHTGTRSFNGAMKDGEHDCRGH
jgi:hypothetical protein